MNVIRVRNHVTNQLNESKKIYFHNILLQSKNNMRKVWNTLNGIIKPNKNPNDRNVKSLLINDELIENDTTIPAFYKMSLVTPFTRRVTKLHQGIIDL